MALNLEFSFASRAAGLSNSKICQGENRMEQSRMSIGISVNIRFDYSNYRTWYRNEDMCHQRILQPRLFPIGSLWNECECLERVSSYHLIRFFAFAWYNLLELRLDDQPLLRGSKVVGLYMWCFGSVPCTSLGYFFKLAISNIADEKKKKETWMFIKMGIKLFFSPLWLFFYHQVLKQYTDVSE